MGDHLIGCLNDRHIEGKDEFFHDDAVMHGPQSGKTVRRAMNRKGIYSAFPQRPTITPHRMLSAGHLIIAL